MGKRKDGIIVSFVDSMSAEDVTGSMVYVKTPNHNILIDCGAHQTNSKYKDFMTNRRRYKDFKAKDIDLVFIRENHADHNGMIPKLIKLGGAPRIIVPENMSRLLKIMLTDSANINERDIELINHQQGTSYEPLYNMDDVNKTMSLVEESPIKTKIKIDDEISYELIPNAHLFASASLLLYITVNNVTKTLYYTGDIGNTIPHFNPFVGEFCPIEKANLVITEATYGAKENLHISKKEREYDLQKIETIVDHTIKNMKGKVLIPTFAQSRAQQIALYLYRIYKNKNIDFDVYVDSPLSIQIFREYANVLQGDEQKEFIELMNWEHLKFTELPEASQGLCESTKPAVIIASSGFMTQGRVRHHAKKMITNPLNSIIFMGYSSEGSLASQIKNNKVRKVEIDQKEYVIRCSVFSLKSFSGHIMCDQLLDYIGGLTADRVVIHHANKQSKENFAKLLKARYEANLRTTKVSCSNSSMRISM